MKKGFLVLESGEIYPGLLANDSTENFNKAGEVVFNTSHSGYEEIATDPSYFSQIIVMTAPMQGNYGIDTAAWESRQIWMSGFVCLQIQNTTREKGWIKLLDQNKVPLLSEVDTRSLAIRLRSGGTPWGALVAASSPEDARELAAALIKETQKIEKDWVYLSSRKQIEDRAGLNPQGPKVAVLDFGAKENILRELQSRCSAVRIFPSRTPTKLIEDYRPDALMLTNGPGDPAEVQMSVQTVKDFLGRVPVFGICMGHQILGLALGAKTFKLKFGHRGANHPIRDDLLNSIYMSSQNHGYAVVPESLPEHVIVTHKNLNDQTVAGFYSEKFNCLGIQYHPESHPGPHEAVKLFDFFTQKMCRSQKQGTKVYDL